MTDNIIRFPAKPERNWREIEPAIDGLIDLTQLPADSRGRIKERLKAFYDVLGRWHDIPITREASLPGPFRDGQFQAICESIDKSIIQPSFDFVQGFAKELVMERLKREIEVEMSNHP